MRRFALAFVPLLFALVGCGDSLPPETSPDKGRDVMKTVLDTWVQGGTPADLKKGTPPIVAYDPDWESGLKLVKYVIDPENARVGVDLLLKVTLSLAKPDGKAQDKTVNFAVAIGSQTAVLRHQ